MDEMADWEQIRALESQGQSDKVFELLQTKPAQDARDWYNLGTAALKIGKPGLARAYLEKALVANQRSQELPTPWIEKNLSIARVRLQDQVGTAALREVRLWNEVIVEQPWFLPLEATAALACLVAGAWVVRRRNLLPWGLVPLIFLLLSILDFSARSSVQAFALEDSVVRSGPGTRYLEIGRAEAGTPVRFTGETRTEGTSPWIQVRFENLALGWLPEASVLRLR